MADTGDFTTDYLENIYGRYINHAEQANAQPVLLRAGIALEAIKQIAAEEEITVNYRYFLNLFENDPNIVSLFSFWK